MAFYVTFPKAWLTSLSVVILLSCSSGEDSSNRTDEDSGITGGAEGYVEVVSTGMDFELPSEIKSGWTRFRYINNSEDVHFMILEKMPDSIGIENYRNELIPPFMAAFELLDQGNIEAGMKEFEKIPDWFAGVELGGGVGLTSAHTTTESTIFLTPGVYVLECYVRMPNGMAHAFMGMIEELTVTEEANGQSAPEPDYQITLSSKEGISFRDSLQAGTYTFAVKFDDQKQYETMLGHDLNLVKLQDPGLLDTLDHWINAADIKAFRTPAPQGLAFLGGVEDLPAGSVGYFKATLREGEYVLISEIPQAVERNMFKTFHVYDQVTK